MASSGFHSNGYSLVRRVVSAAGLDLHATPAGLDRPLGEELLEPTRIYARDCLALVAELGRRAACTPSPTSPAAGWPATPPGWSPRGSTAVLDRGTWALPPAVRLMEEHGVPREESERAFNCGVGMVAAVAAEAADAAVAQLAAAGVPAWVAGTIEPRTDGDAPAARLAGSYR